MNIEKPFRTHQSLKYRLQLTESRPGKMTIKRITAYNSTFAIGRVSCSAGSFVVTERSELRINICAKKQTTTDKTLVF